MVEDLLKSNQDFCNLLSECAEESDNQNSRGTSNLVDDLNETHGKFVWMLRSYLETSSTKVKEEVEEETEEEITEETTEE